MKKEIVKKILDIWIPYQLKELQIPGISISIRRDNNEFLNLQYGYSDVKNKKKITNQSIFRLASLSKFITAVAILKLIEQKKIKLSDPVSKYINWFPQKNRNKVVTIKHLLTHSSGLFRDGVSNHWGDGIFPDSTTIKNEFSKNSFILPVGNFKYSNYGYAILGEIIKNITGVEYNSYITNEIFKKNNISDLYIDYSNNIKNICNGYEFRNDIIKKKLIKFSNTKSYSSATGLLGTTNDYAKFIDSVMFGNIISKNIKQTLLKNYSVFDKELKKLYSLGVQIETINKNKVFTHSGGFMGFSSQMYCDPKHKITLCVSANSTTYVSHDIIDSIISLVLEKDSSPKEFGMFSNEWGDVLMYPYKNNYILSYLDCAQLIFKKPTILKVTKEKDIFVIDTDNMGPFGEKARLVRNKKGAIVELICGGLHYKKQTV